MSPKQLKLELFHVRKAFFQFDQGPQYLKSKLFTAKKILQRDEPLEKPITNPELSIHILIGHIHILMTLWALGSFYAASNFIGELYIHSDGTWTGQDKKILRQYFPQAKLIEPDEVLSSYQVKFSQYPKIRDFRAKHAHNFFLTKLVDPFFVSDKKYQLFFDVDILWFKSSPEIAAELNSGCQRSFMMQGSFAGGGSSEYNTVYFQDGSLLDPKYSNYNGGIMLYRQDNLDMDKMADYFERLDMTRPESQHWVEQSGYAYNLKNLNALTSDKYIIKGPVKSNTICKHYTGPRRVLFYTEGINILKDKLLS